VAGFGAEAAVDAGGERKRQRPIDFLLQEVEEFPDVIGLRVVELQLSFGD